MGIGVNGRSTGEAYVRGPESDKHSQFTMLKFRLFCDLPADTYRTSHVFVSIQFIVRLHAINNVIIALELTSLITYFYGLHEGSFVQGVQPSTPLIGKYFYGQIRTALHFRLTADFILSRRRQNVLAAENFSSRAI